MAGKNETSETLKTVIQLLTITQKEFSTLTKISESTISEMLKGKRPMSAGAALKIKRAFPQLRIDYLMHGTGAMIEQGADAQGHDCAKYKIRVRELEEENIKLKAQIYDLQKMLTHD